MPKQSSNSQIEQPSPSVTPADVKRILRRDYLPNNVAEASGMVAEYGNSEIEPARVRLAMLKLAAGNIDRLKLVLNSARQDFRDVLVAAEYPEYSNIGINVNSLTKDELRQIINSDWQQYQDWLNRR